MTIGDQGGGGVQHGACHGCNKEVTKVVEEVNKELVNEVNEGLLLVCRCGADEDAGSGVDEDADAGGGEFSKEAAWSSVEFSRGLGVGSFYSLSGVDLAIWTLDTGQ